MGDAPQWLSFITGRWITIRFLIKTFKTKPQQIWYKSFSNSILRSHILHVLAPINAPEVNTSRIVPKGAVRPADLNTHQPPPKNGAKITKSTFLLQKTAVVWVEVNMLPTGCDSCGWPANMVVKLTSPT